MKAEEIKSWRKRHKFTQVQVAAVIGQTPVVVSKIENGKRNVSPAEAKLLENLMSATEAKAHDKNAFEVYFTPQEWAKINTLTLNDGFSDPLKWIASKIKNYIAMHK